IGTTAFQNLALSELTALGVSGFPLLVVQHPLGGERPESVARRAQQAVEQLASLIRGARGAAPAAVARESAGPHADLHPPITIADGPRAVLAAFTERQGGDGLPIVPPTEERVRAMLGGADPRRSLGAMAPLWRQATLESLAVNAVMAGCEPEYFPVLVAAV